MAYRLRVIFIVGLLLNTTVMYAQLKRNFMSFTVDEGLAQNTVWAMLQDYKGYLWIGTADGINVYDGNNFRHYKYREDNPYSISGVTNFRFYEDQQKRLWISHDKGICYYDRVHDRFITVYKDNRYATLVTRDGNKLWFISGNTDLVAIDCINGKVLRHIELTKDDAYTSSIRGYQLIGNQLIAYLNDHNNWLSFNLKTEAHHIVKTPPKMGGSFIALNAKTLFNITGKTLQLYDLETGKFRKQAFKGVELVADEMVPTSLVYYNGELLIGSAGGLYVFDTTTFEVKERIQSFEKDEEFGFCYVQNLYVDRSNNLWICTNGNGLKCYSPYRNKFRHYASPGTRNSLVKSVAKTSSGYLFAGTWSGDLLRYDRAGQLKQVTIANNAERNSSILGMTGYTRDRILAVNYNHLVTIDAVSMKETNRTPLPGFVADRSVAYPAFCKTGNDSWLLAADFFVYRIRANGKPEMALRFQGEDTLLTCIQSDSQTGLWYLGTTKGLLVCEPQTRKIRDTGIRQYIKSICLGTNGKIYVSTDNGLYEINRRGILLNHYDITSGMPDDFLYSVLEDQIGNLWMSHNKGISALNLQSRTFRHFGIRDGLGANEFNTGAYLKDESGKLYFGCMNGVNEINPVTVPINPNHPAVSINQINLGDVLYATDTATPEITSLDFDYFQNTLSFDFSALEFSLPDANTYKYELAGYDNGWIESGTRHFARYANLPPGEYVFRVLAANGDGVWSDTPTSLFIRIRPPYWQTAWFYALMVVLLLVLFSGLVYYLLRRQFSRARREREIQIKLEGERIRISRDLHDNVGAQLSYLITNIDWMLANPQRISPAEEKQRLLALSETGRNAILTLRQTIWAISNKELSVEEFADRFKQFVLKMLEFSHQIQVTFKEEIAVNRPLTPVIALNLFRLCQEAFNNAYKHAQASQIRISFGSDPQHLFRFELVDDGIGFDTSEISGNGHYGLSNMKARAEEAGAVMEIISSPGGGTTVRIAVV